MNRSNISSMQSLLDAIRQAQSSFSAAQRLVAAYVVENSYQIPFLSITQLAKNIGVSDSTVIKFCNQLGYEKFGEFKKALSEYAHIELIMSNKLSESSDQIPGSDFFQAEMEEDLAAVQATLNDPSNRASLTRLLPMLEKARHIYITAGRASSFMAGLFANALRYLGLKVYEISFGIGDYWDKLSLIEKDDLLIAISLPRYTAQVVAALEHIHKASIPIVLITDTGLSPAVPYADIVFYCTVTSSSYFPCYTGCLSLISALCRGIGAARKEQAADHISRLERQLIEQGVFR